MKTKFNNTQKIEKGIESIAKKVELVIEQIESNNIKGIPTDIFENILSELQLMEHSNQIISKKITDLIKTI